jgi:predicted nucleic acid-binding protein
VIHLDTSFLVRAAADDIAVTRELKQWFRSGEQVRISAIAWAEFGCGPVREDEEVVAARIVGEPIPFTGADAAVAARLFNLAGRRRGSLPDCMIAAVAIAQNALLATADGSDFRRFTSAGLNLYDS